MFGLDFITILMVDIISQTLNLPHKLMHLFDKLTNGIAAVWKVIVAAAAAIAAELKVTEQLTFTFSVHRSLLPPNQHLKVETHCPRVESVIKLHDSLQQPPSYQKSPAEPASPPEKSADRAASIDTSSQ